MAQKEFFPTLLYRLLEDDKSRGYIEWSPAGDAFYIKDEANFEQFLSHAFNNSKYSTFYRQLNLYGFRRRRDNSLFYHPKFIKGKPHDVGTIRRKTKREKMLITGLTGKATNTNPPTAVRILCILLYEPLGNNTFPYFYSTRTDFLHSILHY